MRWRRGLALHLEASTVIFDVTPMVLKHSKMFWASGDLFAILSKTSTRYLVFEKIYPIIFIHYQVTVDTPT